MKRCAPRFHRIVIGRHMYTFIMETTWWTRTVNYTHPRRKYSLWMPWAAPQLKINFRSTSDRDANDSRISCTSPRKDLAFSIFAHRPTAHLNPNVSAVWFPASKPTQGAPPPTRSSIRRNLVLPSGTSASLRERAWTLRHMLAGVAADPWSSCFIASAAATDRANLCFEGTLQT